MGWMARITQHLGARLEIGADLIQEPFDVGCDEPITRIDPWEDGL